MKCATTCKWHTCNINDIDINVNMMAKQELKGLNRLYAGFERLEYGRCEAGDLGVVLEQWNCTRYQALKFMSWMEGNLVLTLDSGNWNGPWHFDWQDVRNLTLCAPFPDGGAWWSRRCWFQSETPLGQDRYTCRPLVQIDGGRCEGNLEVSLTFWYSINTTCSRYISFRSIYIYDYMHIFL